MDFYSHPKYANQESLIPWYIPNDGWNSDKIELIIRALKNRSFFVRFSQSHIRHFLKFMRVKKYTKGEILFVETEIMVLLDGMVFMKGHSDDVLQPKMLAKYQQGDIIGCKAIDNGISNKVESWCIANVPTEVAIFDPKDFDFIWSHHKESKTETLVKILKTHPLFALLCDQTTYLLAYELIKVRRFKVGTLVLAQSKRSQLNYCYREFFEQKMAQL